jgi:hypothetical protein
MLAREGFDRWMYDSGRFDVYHRMDMFSAQAYHELTADETSGPSEK